MGGVEYLFKNLIEGLSKRGFEVSVLTRRLKGTPRQETIEGVKILRIRTFNRYLFTFLSLPMAIIMGRGCNLIHTTTFNGAFPAWVASRIWGVPIVITIHEVWLNKWRTLTDMNWGSAAIHSFLERLIYLLRFDFYIAVSHSTENQLIEAGIEKKRLKAVYNGFEHEFFSPERYDGNIVRERHGLGDAFVCFSWGRPGVSKGHEYLVKAIPLIVKAIPHARFLLMLSGRDSYKKRYRYLTGLIQRLGLNEKVLLIDPVPRQELGHYLKSADCIVIPSLAEGFGYTVLEACRMGRPVVASNTTSIPEVIGGKYVLVEPKSPEAIVKGVEMVYHGKYTISDMKVFAWEKAISEYANIYEKLSSTVQ
ncbi:MAG: hypothetical protein A2X87_04755 [Deltaproteobacteria bacterium GWC2_42_51]|nr:MAG: hypothetical protein A2X87_04755 [Deltaproteobacteria bacterium GWC2_42_51]OGP38522.1 MAG: hypothetical protein A2090_03505 [Deltaproteobacteria bacterium GWD2_42_10]OGP48102.1 MAG: hypothetical protein A2022_02175 [Deltaproteobacteria bacterium GWF2_42_12]OGQ36753.1 MAG: hypothetical protein A3H47_04570 [Deltaproteobacteria bacterium RIFCSPLOWO2_02_FULL_42_39]OGQ66827.1 MAG: hypothetical protein A3F88_05740 [Deltaproteobacteria bacterium RIFCSPLOWO2_12_FULL_42_16]OGQ71389.1 MAG: hypot